MSAPAFGEVVIEVLDSQAKPSGGTFQNDKGEEVEWKKRTQQGALYRGAFVEEIEIRLEDGAEPYPPGRYRYNMAKMLKATNGKVAFSKYAFLMPLIEQPAETAAAARSR